MALTTGVFAGRGGVVDTISDRGFYMLLGFILSLSMFGTVAIASIAVAAGYRPGWGMMLLTGMLLPLVGITAARFSTNPVFSFAGVGLVSGAYGVVLTPLAERYSAHLVQNACMATGCVAITMMCLAAMYPGIFNRLGGALFAAMIGLMVARLVQLFLPTFFPLHLLDWLGTTVFSLYIGYDWNRASRVAKTATNACNVALDIYLDIINLFFHLLSLMASSRD